MRSKSHLTRRDVLGGATALAGAPAGFAEAGEDVGIGRAHHIAFEVDDVEKGSQGELQKFLSNESDLHSVMISLEKADLSFQTMMQVRNKIVSAYQEIMKAQV